MNSDLTQTDSVLSTDNPQGVSSLDGASRASDFQQAAGTEVLNGNHSLSVASNGQRITPAKSPGTDFGTYLIILIGAVIFFFVTKRLYAWVQAASDAPAPVVPTPAAPPKPAAVKKPKKKSRSKRRQTK